MADQRVNGNLVLIGSLGGTVALGAQASGGGFTYLLPTTIPQIGQSLIVSSVFNGNTANLQWVSSASSIVTTPQGANQVLLGPISGSPAAPSFRPLAASDLSNAIFGASGPNHSAGAVPDPGSVAGTTRFLREDATWTVIATPQLPVTFGAVANQFLKSYTSTTGLFTAAQPAFTNLSGSIVTGQIPAATVTVAQINATGTPSSTTFLRGDGSWAVPAGGGSSAFSSITSGTNTAATMTVGSGASIVTTGTGVVEATELATTGAAVVVSTAAPPTVGQVLTATSATAAHWATSGGGGGSPASPSGSLQYNNSGAFGAVLGSSVNANGNVLVSPSTGGGAFPFASLTAQGEPAQAKDIFTLLAYSPFGTVNTNGTAVTWVSGDLFNTSGNPANNWIGSTIFINGTQFIILSVTDNQHLTLTTSAGVQNGVVYQQGANSWGFDENGQGIGVEVFEVGNGGSVLISPTNAVGNNGSLVVTADNLGSPVAVFWNYPETATIQISNDASLYLQSAGLRDSTNSLGTNGQVLTSTGSLVQWQAPSGGGATLYDNAGNAAVAGNQHIASGIAQLLSGGSPASSQVVVNLTGNSAFADTNYVVMATYSSLTNPAQTGDLSVAISSGSAFTIHSSNGADTNMVQWSAIGF